MEKTVKLFWLWVALVVALYGNSAHQEQINQFDKQFPRVNSEGLLKLHHMLKNIYIQSIIENDTALKIDALERLIKSSNSLRLDASPYEKSSLHSKHLKLLTPQHPNQAQRLSQVQHPKHQLLPCRPK
jgi:N-acetylmuramoyl-L-alanine amidase